MLDCGDYQAPQAPQVRMNPLSFLGARDWLESNMYLDPSEEVNLQTAVAWHLPSDLGRFIDPTVRRISDVKMCKHVDGNHGRQLSVRFISHHC